MYQKITIVGNLGGDPEMKYMPDGNAVTNFSVATSRRWTDKSSGEPRDETTWFRVAVWGQQAESVNQYLSKGSKVLVEARLTPDPETGSPRTFTRNDGTTGASYEVTANTVKFLSTREEDSATSDGGNQSVSSQAVPAAKAEQDEIPF